MNAWVMLVLGLALGGALAWLLASLRARGKIKAAEGTAAELRNKIGELQGGLEKSRQEITNLQQQVRAENEQKVEAQTELKQLQQSLEALSSLNLAEQKKLLEDARGRLVGTLNALSARTLKTNSQAFLDLAKRTLGTIQNQAKEDLETRQKAIEGLVGPLQEALEEYERQIQEMEKTRQSAQGSLDEQLRNLGEADQGLLQEETRGKAAAAAAGASAGSPISLSAQRPRDPGATAGEGIEETIENSTLTRLRELWPLLSKMPRR